MGAHGIHRAAVHDDDAVRVLYGGDALGNDELCRFGIYRRSAWRISASVRVSTALVESSRTRILGFFQQRAGNAQALLLPAGDIGAALLDMGVVAVRELADKLIRLRQACSSSISIVWRPCFPNADFPGWNR